MSSASSSCPAWVPTLISFSDELGQESTSRSEHFPAKVALGGRHFIMATERKLGRHGKPTMCELSKVKLKWSLSNVLAVMLDKLHSVDTYKSMSKVPKPHCFLPPNWSHSSLPRWLHGKEGLDNFGFPLIFLIILYSLGLWAKHILLGWFCVLTKLRFGLKLAM